MLKCNIYSCYYVPVKLHQQLHHPPIFNILFLISFSTYYYIFLNFSHPFYLFISPLLSALISLFLYPFIFFYFLLSYFPPLTINLQFSFPFYLLFFHTQNVISLSLSLSLSLSFLMNFFNTFSCISTLR